MTCYLNGWPEWFPQHGVGPKHTRRIVLDGWQYEALTRNPDRHRRLVGGRDYPAYSFSNRSEDILALFARACELLGVGFRRASRSTISVARRRDVARLDRLMPHKLTPIGE